MGAGNLIDLSLLPAPAVVEALDAESYVAAYKVDLVARDPTLADALALESEPVVKLIEACAYRELLLRNRINVAAQANMLAYARGPDLDNLCANLGVQRLAGELDGPLLIRATEAPDGWSTAGPSGAYKFHAQSASSAVADVYVDSPAPCQVRVAILSTDPAGVPSPDVLAAVTAALSADDVRPLTDQVSVVPAQVAAYDVVAQLVLKPGPDQATVVSAARTAVQAYAAAQRSIGKKVARNGLIAALMQPGVEDLTLSSPAADIAATPEVAPVLGVVTLTYTIDATDG